MYYIDRSGNTAYRNQPKGYAMKTQRATKDTLYEVAEQAFDAMGERLIYLYSRWQDEREYEDWADYAKEMAKTAAQSGFVAIKTAKRPFGFTAKHHDIRGWVVTFKITARSCAWSAKPIPCQ